jgi:3-oxoacyl-[acyl-carrier-protein] synthase-3
VQNKLGAKKAWGFDLIAACSGFVYGLTTAAHLVGCGSHQKVLVIGSDTMSRIIDYTDRSTCVIFGDGAGAMLVERAGEGEELGFIDFSNEIDGSGGDYLKMPAGGSRMPASVETVQNRMHYVHQEGQQVFKYAVRKMYDLCSELLERNCLKLSDVDWLIPHQANKRIINAVAEKMGLTDRVIINIEEFGNTTAATIPLATRTALESGRLKKGNLVLFAAVGAGYTAGANLWRWGF